LYGINTTSAKDYEKLQNKFSYELPNIPYKNAKQAKNLPEGISIISGMSSKSGQKFKELEFWDLKRDSDPIKTSSEVKLQFLIYRHFDDSIDFM
jgi:hypothetical protein